MNERQYSCLIVEDSPSMRQLLLLALARLKNLSLTEASDAVEGMRKLADATFDVIITDINMPIVDGLKFIKWLRGDPKHKNVPILVVTTRASEEDRQRALDLGVNAYLSKPIHAAQILATVEELLEMAQPQRRDETEQT
jgi:two-component system chemotaxis response regulator CheY